MSKKLISLEELTRFYDDLRASGIHPVISRTKAEWNSKAHKLYVPKKGQIIVYTDFKTDPETGGPMPAIKVGTGSTYVCDLPFVMMPDQDYSQFVQHMNNAEIHINNEERNNWNSKISCDYIEESERLTFSDDNNKE